MRHVLEMIYPASWWHDMWREGLAIGNGVTGGNLYGGAKREILQLNRHDFWHGGRSDEVPDVHEALIKMREKMDRGEYKAADWEIVNALKEQHYNSQLEMPLPIANMIVEQTPIKGFKDFRRRIYMEQGVAEQEWVDGFVRMRRNAFISRVHDIAVYKISAEGDNLNGNLLKYLLNLDAYRNVGEESTDAVKEIRSNQRKQVVCESDKTVYLYFHSECPARIQGRGFGAVARVEINEGTYEAEDSQLVVRGATQILITIGLYSEGDCTHKWPEIHNKLNELSNQKQNYNTLLKESSDLHKSLYHSAELHLGDWENVPETQWRMCNEELLMEAYSEKQSVELIEKLWHFGRYLFLCGSAPSSNPFPLYGLWSGCYTPQWCHNMANENLQMIYWHSLCGNLIEQNQAIFQYMNDRIPAFTENGRKLFGIDGIYMTAGTTPGVAAPTQVVPVIINWIGAAGWIAQHYYQYFLYTRDQEFAQKTMIPYLDGVARFYEGFVQFSKDANNAERVRLYPSVSPENTPSNFVDQETVHMAHPMPTTINSTIDLAIMKEFFSELLKVCEEYQVWDVPCERKSFWKRILNAIPDFSVNDQGAVREWQEPAFEDNYEHRHLSHIYPVFPGQEIYPERDPERIKGYEKAVQLRKIDAQTGWSMAHMAAIYARFRDGSAAMECLDNMAKSSLLNNFFTLHNDWRGMNISLNLEGACVQLDAIMGYVNAIQEMLLYVSEGYIALLPAPEERIYKGKLKNFRYCDGVIEMQWDVVNRYFIGKIHSLRKHKVQIVMPEFTNKIQWKNPDNIREIRKNVWEAVLSEGETITWESKEK